MENFVIVTEIFIDGSGNSNVASVVYFNIESGMSAFYDKARFVPLFTDAGYKAVTIQDGRGSNVLPPVIKVNNK